MVWHKQWDLGILYKRFDLYVFPLLVFGPLDAVNKKINVHIKRFRWIEDDFECGFAKL